MNERAVRNIYIVSLLFGVTIVSVAGAANITSSVLVTLTPAPPSNLGATTISTSQINLSWTDNSPNENGFSVERKTGAGGTYAEIATTSANIAAYADTGLSPATTYFYRIAAFNTDGNSAYSNEASSTTQSSSGGGGGGGSNSGGGGGGDGSTYFPVIPTGAIFKGTAYPMSDISIIKDGAVVVVGKAGPDAKFEISLTGLQAGSYNFGVWSEDTSGNRSTIYNFNISVTAGATNVISGIFLSPTMSLDKTQIKRGDILTVVGQSAPSTTITITTNSDNAIVEKVATRDDGSWLYKLDTDLLELGDHTMKSQSISATELSGFSRIKTFAIGDTNIYATVQKKSQGDLNQDSRINLIDFSIMAYWYNRTITDQVKNIVDLNGDGKVNLTDFSILAYYWTG